MANEIRVTAYLEAIKGNFTMPRTGKSLTLDMDGEGGAVPGLVLAELTETYVNLYPLQRPGWLIMQNLDADNYVDWGVASNLGDGTGTGTGANNDGLVGRMYPDEIALFRLHQTAELFLRAAVAPCRVMVQVLED